MPKRDLSGKVVVVTGASMGIGEAIAGAFAGCGASVVLLSRDAGRAEAARSRMGHPERTLALACDVRHREEIDRVLSLTLHHFGRVDIWVNNAGHGLLDAIATLDMAACRDTFDTNFFGTIAAMQGGHTGDEAARLGDDPQRLQRRRAHPASLSCSLQRDQVRHECSGKSGAIRAQELWHTCDDRLSGLRAHRL